MCTITEFPRWTSYQTDELEELKLAGRFQRLDKAYHKIYLALLRGYRLPSEYRMFLGSFNVDARIYYNPDDDFVYFLSRDNTLCRMKCRLAKNFNWNYLPVYNLADISEDLLDPYTREIYYKGGECYVP